MVAKHESRSVFGSYVDNGIMQCDPIFEEYIKKPMRK